MYNDLVVECGTGGGRCRPRVTGVDRSPPKSARTLRGWVSLGAAKSRFLKAARRFQDTRMAARAVIGEDDLAAADSALPGIPSRDRARSAGR